MQGRFGWVLRNVRLDRQIKQSALALHLGVRQQYLSRVELGEQAPFAPRMIRESAAFMGCDAVPLLIAAAIDRGRFPGLPASGEDLERCEAAQRLTDSWCQLSVDQIRRIVEAIEARGDK